MATRAKIDLKATSLKPLAQVHNNFTEMVFIMPSTKIAQMVLLLKTKWLPELKIEISSHSFIKCPNLKYTKTKKKRAIFTVLYL